MRLIVAALVACCMPVLAWALPVPVERLEGFLAAATAGNLEFRQTAIDTQGHRAQSFGNLAYVRPDKFRLRYSEPDKLEIVSNGEVVWIHDVTLRQVIVSKLADVPGARGFLAVLAGGDGLDHDFSKVSKLGADGESSWLVLVPTNPDVYQFKECAFSFNEQGDLRAMRVIDLSDQELRATFTAKAGAALPASAFEFQIPSGTEVIQQGN